VRERGVPIITFNPLRERGLERFTNPQSPIEMLTLSETKISTQYHQLQPGSDLAVLVGMSKALLALDDEANAAGTGSSSTSISSSRTRAASKPSWPVWTTSNGRRSKRAPV